METHPARHGRTLSLGGAALFLGLGVLVFAVGVLPGDSTLYEEAMAHPTPAIREFFSWVNMFGSWTGLLPASLVLLARANPERSGDAKPRVPLMRDSRAAEGGGPWRWCDVEGDLS